MTPRARFRYVLAHRRAGRFGPRAFPGLHSANESLVPYLAAIMFGKPYVSEQHCDIEAPRLKPEWTYTFTPYWSLSSRVGGDLMTPKTRSRRRAAKLTRWCRRRALRHRIARAAALREYAANVTVRFPSNISGSRGTRR